MPKRRGVLLLFVTCYILQICKAILLNNEEQPKPAYTAGIKTTLWRSPNNLQTHQNYSRVRVHNNPNASGHYVVTQADRIQTVYPIYNAHSYGQRPAGSQRAVGINSTGYWRTNRTDRPIYKTKIQLKTLQVYEQCPEGATGQFVYYLSCNQFLNCWKGRGGPQNCAPGTLFNPNSLECDFPEKVECVTGPRRNTLTAGSLQKTVTQVSCPKEFSGLVPNYTDCSKFINCNNGQSVSMDCPPGTLFDVNRNVCDFPYKAVCFGGQNLVAGQTQQQGSYVASKRFPPNVGQHYQQTYFGSAGQQGTSYVYGASSGSSSGAGGCSGPSCSADRYGGGWRGQTAASSQHNTYPPAGQNSRPNCDPRTQTCGGQRTVSSPTTGSPTLGGQNYNKVCNINDPSCHHRPKAEGPKCPDNYQGITKHPTDCKKFLNCANGRTFVQDCAPGTLFNPKLGNCDFPYNVDCESTEETPAETTTVAYTDWQQQYNEHAQKYGQNAGHGNIRVDNTAQGQGQNQGGYHPIRGSQPGGRGNRFQGQEVVEINRGQSGVVTRPSTDYVDVFDPNQQTHYGFRSTTPRVVEKAWPPPFPSTDLNADYVFEYEDGEPVTLEADNVIYADKKKKAVCAKGDFQCSPGTCVTKSMVCDGRRDCETGKDEVGCEEYIARFAQTKNARLEVPEKQRWINVSHTTCALLCIETTKFQCQSFNYRKIDKTCFLTNSNVGLSGALKEYHPCDYYELKSASINCKNLYKCHNGKCIKRDQLCDGHDDCGDRQDEKNCSPEDFGYGIRLGGSRNSNEGRVEVTAFGKTGYICDDKFGIRDANVVCRELGFQLGAAEVKGSSHFAKDLKGRNVPYIMDDLDCWGNETTLLDCGFSGWGVHDCGDQEVAGVVCKTPQRNCGKDYWKCDTGNECVPLSFVCDGVYDCTDSSDEGSQHCEAPTEMRLVNGTSRSSGRVEVRHHGIWGTVCDDDFNEDAAKVVCKYFGFRGTSAVKKDAYFGQGDGPIWLDQVSCYGNETELEKCTHWGWGEHNCDHEEDVGVTCSNAIDVVETERHSKIADGYRPVVGCGLRNDNQFLENDLIHARVVSGTLARKGDYPWQAALRVKGKGKSAHWCGAVVISNRWVLTAAHCLQGYAKGAYVVVAGEYNTDEDEGTEQQKYIDDYFIHEDFRKGHKMNNDIALIRLKGGGFALNGAVQPICLPDVEANYERQLNCTISGFGSVKSGTSAYSHNLMAAWIPVHGAEICKMPHVYGNALTEGMICAGLLDGGVDACDGDSGGPLACLDDGLFTLYGLTSWGQHCGYANKPGVYVKVAHYREWIDGVIKKHS